MVSEYTSCPPSLHFSGLYRHGRGGSKWLPLAPPRPQGPWARPPQPGVSSPFPAPLRYGASEEKAIPVPLEDTSQHLNPLLWWCLHPKAKNPQIAFSNSMSPKHGPTTCKTPPVHLGYPSPTQAGTDPPNRHPPLNLTFSLLSKVSCVLVTP